MLGKQIAAFIAVLITVPLSADELTNEQFRFFENEVRPLLATHCYECHSVQAKKLQAGLFVDSKAGLLRGGDSGPAISEDSQESLLLSAINYDSFEMPPSGKLPPGAVEVFAKWLAMGAPWPEEPEPQPTDAPQSFDWKQRAQEHWCWQPIRDVTPPPVTNEDWPLNELDRFVLAKLESQQLLPAADADRRTWIRRVNFDLIGLPPTPEEVRGFVADSSEGAFAKVVDRLLRSAKFGEKWARHWLDLVRYGETLGHEFDYPLHHAYRYRDYLIRALNRDVPYDQFVQEHVAGDLLATPRRHPTEGFNESIIGTGFWFLGEACHAPTDVKADESDRIDNQIDVFSKTFLGLTVACARCHDHKFDPIPTTDYYALAGYIQSSRRQEALLDPNGSIAAGCAELDSLDQRRAVVWDRHLASTHVNSESLRNAIKAVVATKGEEGADPLAKTHPFYALGQLIHEEAFTVGRQRLLDQLRADRLQAEAATARTESFVDFRQDGLDGWYLTGDAFDSQPTEPGSLTLEGGPLSRPGAVHSGRRGARLQGVLRSPTFELKHKRIHYKLNGREVAIRLIVDGYTMDEFNALLFRDNQKQVNTKGNAEWVSQTRDIYHYVGHRAYIEVIDHGDGFVALEEIRFSDEGAPEMPPHPINEAVLERSPQNARELIDAYVQEFTDTWRRFQGGDARAGDERLANWLLEAGAVRRSQEVADVENEMVAINQSLPKPMHVIALLDGDAENEFVFIRGNHKNLGPEAPRRLPVALGGEQPNAATPGSGRLELAQQLTSSDNPLTSRVIVNRLWHHLFGRGIVPSVDDFGKMGLAPSHPNLLDWLAQDLMHRRQWSIKESIRQIVLSRTYRMSHVARAEPERIQAIDPDNVLLHRAPVRRLSGEAIRDSLLSLAGNLDTTLYGPSVPVHLTPFMEGRGRPGKNGPLDGNGRRSLYVEVRRNFLSPMMLAFDRPSPFSAMGRRSNSNVPAQSLILMNDPFVVQQANSWAGRILDGEGDVKQKIGLAFEMAYARPPSAAQLQRCVEFLGDRVEDEQAWGDLCHTLINMKPFIFVR